MAHYFTNETLKSDLHTFNFRYLDKEITFTSDAGVFSKKFIDYGSQALLDAIVINDQKTLLDVGCGYGAMMLSLAKCYDIHCTGVDVNLRAIELTHENAKVNHIDNYDAFESNVYEKVTNSYDIIISNPPIRAGKSVVMNILENSIHHLNNQGELWIVIQKKQGAPSAKKKMEEVFGNCEIVSRDKGYYILKSKKSI